MDQPNRKQSATMENESNGIQTHKKKEKNSTKKITINAYQ